MIVSETDYAILRNSANSRNNAYETEPIADRFESITQYLCPVQDAILLHSDRDIVEATQENSLLVGITEIVRDDGQVGAVILYPIKTMNVRKKEPWWQVDTGPILIEAGGIAEGTIGSLLPTYNRLQPQEAYHKYYHSRGDEAERSERRF